jgi:DNA modification methylase
LAFDARSPEEAEFGEATLTCGDVLKELGKLPQNTFDLIISSPPYNIGKCYEKESPRTISEYTVWQRKVARRLTKVAKQDANLCWQVGTHVRDGEILPLDLVFLPIFSRLGWRLRNRIVWRFNFGHNSDRRFSGRYETMLWFTRGEYKFNLDPVRIPQLYPGKRHSQKKGEKAGRPSGNPLGKNPSDFWEFSAERDFITNPVWDIPNVKSNHPEYLIQHPCQFPIELAERCVLAMSHVGDNVLDPFVGTGSSVLAAVKHRRSAVGIDKEQSFVSMAAARMEQLRAGNLPMRPLGKPIRRPVPGEKVATVPEEWRIPSVASANGSR